MDSVKQKDDKNRVKLSGTVIGEPIMISEAGRNDFALLLSYIRCASSDYAVSYKSTPANLERMREGNYVNIVGYLYVHKDISDDDTNKYSYKVFATKIDIADYHDKVLLYIKKKESVNVIISGCVKYIRPTGQGITFRLYSIRRNRKFYFICYAQGGIMEEIIENDRQEIILHGRLMSYNQIRVRSVALRNDGQGGYEDWQPENILPLSMHSDGQQGCEQREGA